MSIMFSPTLQRDVDLSDYYRTDAEVEGLKKDYELHARDMAPGIRRDLETLLRHA